MKTGSFGATIHFSRVSASGDGGGSNGGVAVKKYWIDQTAQDNGEDFVRYIRHEVRVNNKIVNKNISQGFINHYVIIVRYISQNKIRLKT